MPYLPRCSKRLQAPFQISGNIEACEQDLDFLTRKQRSETMARIRSIDTKPEVQLRKALFARGLRFRKNVRSLPGKPDIVLPKHNYVIQVRGCFWHSHKRCKRAHEPATNTAYWLPKLARNVARDRQNDRALRKEGWRMCIVWECSISSTEKLELVANRLKNEILQNRKI